MMQSAVDTRRLMGTLGDALRREATLWKPLTYRTPADPTVAIGPEHRKRAVRWLVQLTRKFHFMPDTLALSVTILDRFLMAVKARPRHLNCIVVSSFYLAAKTIEEDPVLPGSLELVQTSECGCSVAEVLRMERCILDKLGWDLRAATPLDFLHAFHALLMAHHPRLLDAFPHMTPSRQLAVLTSKLQALLLDERVLQAPPSALALALLSLELEHFWPDWFAATITLQRLIQVEPSLVIECRELASSLLAAATLPPTHHLYAPAKTAKPATAASASALPKPKAAKRKVEEMEEEDEDDCIYEGIKRLYNEEEPAVLTVATLPPPPAMAVAN